MTGNTELQADLLRTTEQHRADLLETIDDLTAQVSHAQAKLERAKAKLGPIVERIEALKDA